jgi:hypothetical protein
VTVSLPPVILEEGTTGTSTIYTNSTSAKVSVAAPIWLSGWNKRVKIAIDHNDVDSVLSDFPVLVYLSSNSGRDNDDVTFVFDEIGSNSKKIAVTTDDGTTQCYVEIEKWDAANEKAWLWVKVPNISNVTDTVLYLYYDGSHADNTGYVGDKSSTPSRNVWDSNFKGVWHLDEDPAGTAPQMKDSTSNGNDGTSAGSMTSSDQVTAMVDGGLDFDGSNDEITCGNAASLQITTEITIEAWAKTSVSNTIMGIVNKEIGSPDYAGYQLRKHSDNHYIFQIGSSQTVTSNSAYTDSNWHYVVGVRRDGTNYLYVDGVQQTATSTSAITDSGANFDIGRAYSNYNGYWWNGIIDEVRVSNVSRNSAWIKTSYESERDDLIDFGQEDHVDNNTSNVDSSSPADKGTHSNFTAQQYGPDSVYDTLTEENTAGVATSITPITAFQDTQQSTSSASLVDANCETSVLSNGVDYLVIYCGNVGSDNNAAHVELVLKYGTTTIARCTAEGTDQTAVRHCAAGACQGYYIVTGDGTSTLKFQFRCLNGYTAYAGAMGIVAIPLTALTQNLDYWYSISNTENIITNPSTWTDLASQTWNLPETGNYLVLMSAEGGCNGGNEANGPMVRFQLNGETLGSEYTEEWEDNLDNMNFAKATVVSCNSGDNTFAIQVKDYGSTPTADFHRPRIIVIKCSAFDQIVDTSTSTGVSTSSTTYVDWSALTTTYTPNQQEYVVVIANPNGLHHSTYEVPVFQIYDATASTAHRVDSGEYGNAGYGTGHASGADQLAAIAVTVKQQSSATQWKVQIRTENGGTAYYSQTGTGTGHRSDLIIWGLSVKESPNYELDLEVQWTNVDCNESNAELCIYGGTMASEDIRVDVWDGAAWQNLFTDLSSGWNNISVSTYLTSSTFTIRFKGGTETNDTTQDSWNIDAVILHVWTPYNYDYVLKVVNQVADNWTINLEVYNSSSISRISSLNISFHDGTTSNQIIVSGGSITQSKGEPYNLHGGSGSTIYISMSNLLATSSGTSHIYVHLKVLVPNKSTYLLYIIIFEIT